MRSLCFVLLLLVSVISVSHVGPVFASPTLTIVIVAKGQRTFDLSIMAIVPHPWGNDDAQNLYGWGTVVQEHHVSVSKTKTFSYELPSGLYNINVHWIADLGGSVTCITSARWVVLSSDKTVTMVVN